MASKSSSKFTHLAKSHSKSKIYSFLKQPLGKELRHGFSKLDDKVSEAEPPVLDGQLRIIRKNILYSEPICCDISKNTMQKRFLAIGLADGSVEVRDAKNGHLISTLTGLKAKELPIASVSFVEDCSKDNALLLCSSSSGLTDVIDLKSFETLGTITEDRTTLINSVSPDVRRFALSGSDGKINIYDLKSQRRIRTLEKSAKKDVTAKNIQRVFALRYHPFNPYEIITGGWDNVVRLWDEREPHSVRKIFGPHICGDGIDFNEDGQSILTASWSKHGSLQIWDYRNLNLVRDIVSDDYTSFLYCCQWLPEKNLILTGGTNNNMLRVVDCTSSATLGSYKNLAGAVYCLRVILSSVQETRTVFCIGFSNEFSVLELSV